SRIAGASHPGPPTGRSPSSSSAACGSATVSGTWCSFAGRRGPEAGRRGLPCRAVGAESTTGRGGRSEEENLSLHPRPGGRPPGIVDTRRHAPIAALLLGLVERLVGPV